jgi:threonine/homoserine/homoserine lactone efflux protein
MAYMVGTGIAAGRSAAARSALGVAVGVGIFAVGVAIGLGAVVSRHRSVLTGVEVFGALYLTWLAVGTFRDARRPALITISTTEQGRWFRRGVIVNLTNPKVILFFVAFLPQFLGRATNPTLQLLMLGVTFQFIGFAIDVSIGWSAGSFRDRLLAKPGAVKAMTYVSSAVFILLAAIIGIEAAGTLTG